MKNKLPEVGRVVNARLEHCTTGNSRYADLVVVDESDCTWRFANDNAEVSYDWDVIEWVYKYI